MPEFSDEAEVTRVAKRDTRVELLARRRSLPAETRAAAAGRVQSELVALVRRLRPHRMTAYVPVGSEPGGADLPEVLRAALPADAELLLPVLLADLDLDWASYTGPDALVAAGRGIREPVGARLGGDRRGARGTRGRTGSRGRPPRSAARAAAAARTTAHWPGSRGSPDGGAAARR